LPRGGTPDHGQQGAYVRCALGDNLARSRVPVVQQHTTCKLPPELPAAQMTLLLSLTLAPPVTRARPQALWASADLSGHLHKRSESLCACHADPATWDASCCSHEHNSLSACTPYRTCASHKPVHTARAGCSDDRWRRRFCVLKGRQLFWLRSPAATRPLGVLNLPGARITASTRPTRTDRHGRGCSRSRSRSRGGEAGDSSSGGSDGADGCAATLFAIKVALRQLPAGQQQQQHTRFTLAAPSKELQVRCWCSAARGSAIRHRHAPTPTHTHASGSDTPTHVCIRQRHSHTLPRGTPSSTGAVV
jgi:hypothetical protein